MRLRRLQGLLTFAAAFAMSGAQAQLSSVQLYSAGSLRGALTEAAQQFEAQTGANVALTFGASGLLRERIEKGEPAQVFASADMDHPLRLARAGGWKAPIVFALNQMCVLAAPSVKVTPDTLLDTLLRPEVRVGTSTPKADPAGDYAWELFRRADKLRPGAFALLDAKALKLTGGADAPKSPSSGNTYARIMSGGQADVFVTYCTNAVAVQLEAPTLQIISVPPDLQVAARYSLTAREGDAAAARLVHYLLSPASQAVLRQHAFGQP
jgi:molybdate transport system substrate-binding protein